VPFGYICGYPVSAVASELYGYYPGQLAMLTQQGLAVKQAVARWSTDPSKTELDFPVCKSGYRPHDVTTGEPLYGCPRHHAARRARLQESGWRGRPGWEAFHQWEAVPVASTAQESSPPSSSESDSESSDKAATTTSHSACVETACMGINTCPAPSGQPGEGVELNQQ